MRSFWFVVPLLAACSGSDSDSDPDTTPEVFAPEEGNWIYTWAVTENTCTDASGAEGIAGFALALDDDGAGFTWTPTSDDAPFHCTLTDQAYTCDDHSWTSETTDNDVTLTVTVAVAGEFTGTESASGSYDGTVACAGSGCADAASAFETTFPCTFEAPFTSEQR